MADYLIESEQRLNEILKKADALQYVPSIDVYVKDTPTDWVMIWATFGAAFFGALSAYLINAVHEHVKERNKRRVSLNSALNSFVIILNTLVNFKNQFFVKFKRELDDWKEHAASYHTASANEELLAEFRVTILPQLSRALETDHSLNGAFQKWEEMEFNLYSPENLGFFLDSSPDDLRIFEQVRDQLHRLSTTIKLRNEEWDKLLPLMEKDLLNPTTKSMLAAYQLLSLRSNIEEYVNTALILIIESIERIEKYREKHFPKRFVLWRWLFPKRRWVKYKLPEKVRELIPDREQYKDMITPNEKWGKFED
jgi:hypothetical protein